MMRRRVRQARVGRLASVGADGAPHLVPVCFELTGDRLVTVVDHKPKTTYALRRLDNIRANPAVTLLVDHFEEDWSRLWWVRVDGRAHVVDDAAEVADLVPALLEKYRGHYGLKTNLGSAIVVDLHHWVGWAASPAA
jgi:PPOX class probable F420-dependent enzyme